MGKSTWKYNKLLTGRRNYFDIGGTLTDWSKRNTLVKNFTSDWWNGLGIEDKVAVEDWLEQKYNYDVPLELLSVMGVDISDEYLKNRGLYTGTPFNLGTDPRNSLVTTFTDGKGNTYNFSDRTPLGDPSPEAPDDSPTIVTEDEDKIIPEENNSDGMNNIVKSVAPLVNSLITQTGKFVNNVSGNKVKQSENSYRNIFNNAQLGLQPSGYSWNNLLSDWGANAKLPNVTAKDLGAKSGGAMIGDALSAGLSGALGGLGLKGLFGGASSSDGGSGSGTESGESGENGDTYEGGNSAAYGGPLNYANKYLLGGLISGAVNAGINLVGNLINNNKAKKAEKRLGELRAYTEDFNKRTLVNRGNNLMGDQMFGLKANSAAFGGPIDNWDGAIGYQFTNDWLNNKQLAAQNKGTYNSMMLPRLGTFALGGNLMTHGADWDTRLMAINAGGSHESNPYEGVPMGVDQQGTPNLVEEGETVFNDYVFSRRLMVPEWFRKKYKLGGKISFADASKKLARESEERPNDPISQNGLEALMMDLANAQEEYKARQREKEEAQMFALGGRVNKFAGTNPWTPSKIRSYKGLGNSYYGFGDTPFWIVDGKYSDDYYNYIDNIYDEAAFRQHLKDQFAYYDDPNVDKNSKRYQAIDYFIKSNPDWYNNRGSIDSWNIDDKLMKQVKKLAKSNPGFMHPEKAAGEYLGAPSLDSFDKSGEPYRRDLKFHRLRQKDGSYTDMPNEAWYYSLSDGEDPQSYSPGSLADAWEKKWGHKYSFEGTEKDEDGSTIYWYNPVTGNGSTGSPNSPAANTGTGKNRHIWQKDGQQIILGDDYLDVIGKNKLKEKARIAQPDNSEFYDYIYEVQKELPPLEKSPFEKTRGLWSLLNNGIQFGISAFNGPDLSNADAMLEAVRNPGEVTEISPDLIGNYIKYKPFDIERGINALNSQLGAGIRSLANTSSGNRGTLQAGVLAALNNANNQTGNMYRQAMEYNRADEFKTYEANKDTDKFNAEAKRAVALANQSTRANARSSMLNGLLTAYAARQNAIDNYNQGLTVNLNSIAETLENKAYEDKMANLAKWYIENGGKPGTETLFAAKGGKLKRVKRKGLTF